MSKPYMILLVLFTKQMKWALLEKINLIFFEHPNDLFSLVLSRKIYFERTKM
jgi:hypothetical protein